MGRLRQVLLGLALPVSLQPPAKRGYGDHDCNDGNPAKHQHGCWDTWCRLKPKRRWLIWFAGACFAGCGLWMLWRRIRKREDKTFARAGKAISGGASNLDDSQKGGVGVLVRTKNEGHEPSEFRHCSCD